MSLFDKLRQTAAEAKSRRDTSHKAATEAAADHSRREVQLRRTAFERAPETCPLPRELHPLNDEFLVAEGKKIGDGVLRNCRSQLIASPIPGADSPTTGRPSTSPT